LKVNTIDKKASRCMKKLKALGGSLKLEKRLFEKLDGLNIKEATLLLDKDINLSVDYFTRKRIEKSINKKIGYYDEKIYLYKR